MIIEFDYEEEIYRKNIVTKYFQRKHEVLIFIKVCNDFGRRSTVKDVRPYFRMTRYYAYKVLEKLEDEGLIKK